MRDVGWTESVGMIDMLAGIIQSSGYKPDVLIGITRGGLFSLARLSYKLDVKIIDTIALEFYDKNNKTKDRVEQLMPFHLEDLGNYRRVLVVDDVADTGRTLEYVLSKLDGKEVRTATLFYKLRSKIRPDYYVEETEEWINFPWSA